MLIFLAYRGLLAESALVFLIEEMKEKAQGEKFKDQCAIQVGKDLFTRISYGISKIFLLTLPYSSLLTPRKKKRRESFAVCCLDCLNIHWSLTPVKWLDISGF